jgi:hypothetical protein
VTYAVPMEPSQFEVRCKRAMGHALWFSAAFTIICGVLAFTEASGFVSPGGDLSISGLLTVIGAFLFAANLAARRFFLP